MRITNPMVADTVLGNLQNNMAALEKLERQISSGKRINRPSDDPPAVETVETYQRWTEKLSTLLGGGVTASGCLAIIVLAAVVSVIASTMRLLLTRRRMEVEVLKLVGASDAFVRRPFVIEGAPTALAALLTTPTGSRR